MYKKTEFEQSMCRVEILIVKNNGLKTKLKEMETLVIHPSGYVLLVLMFLSRKIHIYTFQVREERMNNFFYKINVGDFHVIAINP